MLLSILIKGPRRNSGDIDNFELDFESVSENVQIKTLRICAVLIVCVRCNYLYRARKMTEASCESRMNVMLITRLDSLIVIYN